MQDFPGLKYSGRGIDAMKAIADAGKKRDISIFNETIAEYDDELKKDPVVQNHLKALYDNLLEKNLVRIIEPYSRVQIAHVAETISLPYDIVEKKLSQIILDKKFSGMFCRLADSINHTTTNLSDFFFETIIRFSFADYP